MAGNPLAGRPRPAVAKVLDPAGWLVLVNDPAGWVAALGVHLADSFDHRCRDLADLLVPVGAADARRRRNVARDACRRRPCWKCRVRSSCVGRQPGGPWIAIPAKSQLPSGYSASARP